MSERLDLAGHAIAVVVVLAAAVYGLATSLSLAPPPTRTPAATASASTSVTAPSPTVAPPASPAPSPSASRRPIATTAYAASGHSYTGVSLGTGWTITAPFDGRVEVHVYQLIDGTIREFTNTPGVPSYPYVIVTAADGRKLTYRPGAVDTDTRVLVPASGTVKAGAGLFTVIGTGPSSWHDFYDPSITFQIVVSLVGAGGSDLDAAPLILAR